MFNLPNEMQYIIFSFFNTKELVKSELINKNHSEEIVKPLKFETSLIEYIQLLDNESINNPINSNANKIIKKFKNITPIIAAASIGSIRCLELIINKGGDINYYDSNEKQSALFAAIKGGHLTAVKYLLEKGADKKHQDELGNNILHIAIINNRLDIFEYLLNLDKPNDSNLSMENSYPTNPIEMLFKLCESPKFNAKPFLDEIIMYCYKYEIGIDYFYSDNWDCVFQEDIITYNTIELIMNSIYQGDIKKLKTICDYAAIKSNQHYSYLYNNLSCHFSSHVFNKNFDSEGILDTVFTLAAKTRNYKIMEYLTKNRIFSSCDINRKNSNFYTPLHIAVANNDTEMVKILTENPNCEVNRQNDKGNTPLHIAIKNKNVEIVKILVAKKADLYLKNNINLTPAEMAGKSQPHIKKYIESIINNDNSYEKWLSEKSSTKLDVNYSYPFY